MMKLRSSIVLLSLAASASLVAACSAGPEGTLGNPNVDDTGNGGDSIVADTGHVTADSGVDTGDSTVTDSGIGDTGHDTKGDSLADVPIIPEGGVASAPIAGAVIAQDAKYKLITHTSQGGSNGPMTGSKYTLHGGTVTVVPK
jgi:hypothetical protein